MSCCLAVGLTEATLYNSFFSNVWSEMKRGVLSRSTRPCGAWLPTPPCGRGRRRFVTFNVVKLINVLSNNYWLLEGGVNWGMFIINIYLNYKFRLCDLSFSDDD